jgi:subtilase family serine protease
MEGAMDLQWAHAMAPNARIILVEACSNSYADMMYAVETAGQKLLAYGGGQVSNSWGSGEFATEVDLDVSFRKNWVAGKPISYIFSSGDSGLGAQYPSSSPWVISAGGTTINRDPSTGAFQSESCWAGSGGGVSTYETYSSSFGTGTGPWTNFQYPLFGQASRATPDVSAVADPNSGAWVRFEGGWYVIGGTSLSAPLMAGIINNANNRLGVAPSPGGYYSNMENNLLYAQLATYKEYKTNFYDVTTGSNGAAAGTGWDYCTGVGTPRGRLGK